MSPSLVLIKTETKQKRLLTFKKKLTIGTGVEADLIVNHPFLHNNPQTLTPGNFGKGITRKGGDKNGGMKSQWSTEMPGLQIRCRSLRLPAVLATVSLLAAILLALVTTLPAGPGVQDWSAIALPAREAYGLCRQDRRHPEGIRFSFKAEASEPHDITFVPGGEGDGSTLAVSVNQNPLPDSIIMPEGWGMKKVIRIPAEMVLVGENSIEFRRLSPSPDTSGWGIREVESIPVTEHPLDQAAIRQTLEGIGAVLREQVLDGPDLGQLHEILNGISIPKNLSGLSSIKQRTLDTVEGRMIEKLKATGFQVRSARTMGDYETAVKLANRTREWLPEGWEEGWRIFNGI